MKRFQVMENAEPIGEGCQFSDRTVAVQVRGVGSFFATLGAMLAKYPWGTAWVDG